MAAGEIEIEYKSPFGVTYDDENDSVRVMVVIQSLKKAFAKNEPSGGKVNFKPEERSFDLTVSTTTKQTGAKKQHHYRYKIKKLPGNIVPGECSYKVKDGKIMIKLKKAENTSWVAMLADTGLETAEDDATEKKEDS